MRSLLSSERLFMIDGVQVSLCCAVVVSGRSSCGSAEGGRGRYNLSETVGATCGEGLAKTRSN